MIKEIIDFFRELINRAILYMFSIHIESLKHQSDNFLDYYNFDDELTLLKETLLKKLKFDLSFNKDVLEQQERTWLVFTYSQKMITKEKREILDFIKSSTNLNCWWSKNYKNIYDEYEYEITVEFFSPEELREIIKKKLEQPKIELVMTKIEEIEEIHPEPINNSFPKKEKRTWDGEWYKKNKEFKREKMLPRNDSWINKKN